MSLFIPFDENMVLVDLQKNQLFAYNASARFIWKGLASGRSEDEVACELVSGTTVPLDIARQDVGRIVDHWRALGLEPS